MGERLKKAFLLFLYSAGCGIFLFVFTIMKGMANLAFSLLAVLIAIHYFKRVSSIRSRIAFVVLALLFFLISVFIYAAVTAAKTAP
ncbi:YfhO family protein [Paenibacillus rhizovicinus]|uniref:YfhO family protein n=1 Tax=Paenibacillus rhizovicinus TaxID=2704463 RepID=A0A6C0P792_9BACL|nr:YfhO family protein [Paenibacillus rhizovicinus]QHW34408.1 YfhO family protein [Paenibacillus rhizovicinus]